MQAEGRDVMEQAQQEGWSWWRNASARAVLGLTVLMVAVVTAFVVWLLLDLRSREVHHLKGEIVSLSRILTEQTSRSMDGVVLAMRNVRDRIDLAPQPLLLRDPGTAKLLATHASGLPPLFALFIVAPDGRLLAASRPEVMRSIGLRDAPYLRQLAHARHDALFVGSSEVTPIDGTWNYYVAMRLEDHAGRWLGVLVAAIDVSYMQSVFDAIRLDSVKRIYLLDRGGAVLVGEPRGEPNERMLVAPGDPRRVSTEHPEAGLSLVTENSARGPRHVAYREVSSYPMTIAAGVDETDALLPWQQVMWSIAMAAVVIVAVLVGVGLFTVRSLARRAGLESALRERDAQLRLMVESIGDGIIAMDATRRIVLINRAAETMLAVQAQDVVGRPIIDVLSGCVAPAGLADVMACFEAGVQRAGATTGPRTVRIECEARGLVAELSLTPMLLRGTFVLAAVLRDLTDRQRAERELKRSNQQLQALSAALQQVREQERARIARELHDELGQALTGIRMEVSWLGGRLSADQQALIDKLATLKGFIDQTITAVRRIASELRPLVLDDLGFGAAAHWYVDQFAARTGLRVALSLCEHEPRPGDAVATALFRILQEALTNVARHAHAGEVMVSLRCASNAWCLTISDDGVGLAANETANIGFGIVSMRERVQILGGRFELRSAPDAGTMVLVEIPVEVVDDDVQAQDPSPVGG